VLPLSLIRTIGYLLALSACTRQYSTLQQTQLCAGSDLRKFLRAKFPRRELLRGPLYYVLILVAVTLVYWRESPVGFLLPQSALLFSCFTRPGSGPADLDPYRPQQTSPKCTSPSAQNSLPRYSVEGT